MTDISLDEPLMCLQTAAEKLSANSIGKRKITARTLRDAINSADPDKRLEGYKIAGAFYVTETDLKAYIEKCRVPRNKPASNSVREAAQEQSTTSSTDQSASLLDAELISFKTQR